MIDTRIEPEKSILEAVGLLKNGAVVAFPTETVYGLGANIFDDQAIQKIYQIKGRPQDNPLIAHVANDEQLNQIVEEIPQKAKKLIDTFWPGPLTLVLKKKKRVSNIASAGLGTIGVRMPNHQIALELIRRFGSPLVAPSANLSGRPSPTTAQSVFDDLHGKIELILDGGPCRVGIESTVLDLSTDIPTILRPGEITITQIENIIDQSVLQAKSNNHVKSPGMKYRHYAPNVKILIIESWEEIKNKSNHLGMLLTNTQPPSAFSFQKIKPLSAHTLFQEFRSAEKESMEIMIFLSEKDKSHSGLLDRIKKAAG